MCTWSMKCPTAPARKCAAKHCSCRLRETGGWLRIAVERIKFGRLLFNLAKRRCVTEGSRFRTRNSVPLFPYSRVPTDVFSRAGQKLALPGGFFESRFRDWGVVQVGGNLPGPILQSAWFRATALAKVRES